MTDAVAKLRQTTPLVQCITNYVSMDIAANCLLAAGASPAMVHASEESRGFAAVASALCINVGTLSDSFHSGMVSAVEGANQAGTPWVLDPVAHFISDWRHQATLGLLRMKPTILRANASEIIAFEKEAAGRGVDSVDEVETAHDIARHLAAEHGCAVAVTGETDFVTDGKKAWTVRGGSPLMAKITATGCALSALCGAYAAFLTPAEAALAACAHFAAAADRAAPEAKGPASFRTAFIDALAAVEAGDIDMDGRITAL